MNEIGELSLVMCLVMSGYGIVAPLLGVKKGNGLLIRSAENSVYSILLLSTLSSIALYYAFMTDDFSLQYVASYSNRDLPVFYKFSAFWAGQKGSLLLWAWMLAVFGGIVVFQNRKKNRELMPYVIVVLSCTMFLFFAILLFSTPPFELIYPPQDGRGLNPMLQNPGMVFHPPSLYIGFVGFTIPFAFALASLITGQLGDVWIKTTRRWTIFSWFFLSMGNLLGAWWAYRVLGWGGYWAWDPVENASFMPWLTGTAYLHSVMIQERKDMLKVWNMVLIFLTFILTIFGTFLTRSGIVQSVHSFGESTVGYYFLAFMILVIIVSVGMIIIRLPMLKSKNELDSILSRESSFLFNNLFLVGIAFATLWGTMFPAISELVRGQKITVGPAFFNQVNVPIGLALIALIGVCPLISWGRATMANFKRNFLKPFIVTAIGSAILIFIVGTSQLLAWISFTICIFVVSTIVIEFFVSTKGHMKTHKESFAVGFYRNIARNPRRWGGHIIHIGVIMMIIGMTGSSFNKERESNLRVGESMSVGDYQLTLRDITKKQPVPSKIVLEATLDVTKAGKPLRSAHPKKDFYLLGSEQPVSRVDNLSTIQEDLYIILAGLDDNLTYGVFKVLINPLVKWMWIGGFVVGFGTIIAMLPAVRRRLKNSN